MPAPVVDSLGLMRQLARMAGVPEGGFRRMVLVLDVNDIPRLYTEGFLYQEETLEQVALQVEEKPMYVDTTTMQNEYWRTKIPRPGSR